MPHQNATPSAGQFSGARVVPYSPETAKQFGGGARGRTLAIIYRQLSYWSKYAKWKGSGGKRFFYKSQKELAEELGYSEKTINRAIKALRELGLVVVEKLHKRYWRQVHFYYLPHSPFAAAEPTPPPAAAAASPTPSGGSFSTTTNPSSRNAVPAVPAASGAPHPAAAASAASIRSRGSGGFGQNVRIQHKKNNPLLKQTLQSVVEKCYLIGERMKKEQEEGACPTFNPVLV